MEKRLTKDEAKEKLRRAKIDLRVAEILSEEHEKAIKEIKEDIEKLKAIINKKDDWKLVEVPDGWQALYEEKALLMADMMHFAYVRNEGWMPDWDDSSQTKYGIILSGNKAYVDYSILMNQLAFGVAVKSKEIAEEMLEIFGERIKKFYNKMY